MMVEAEAGAVVPQAKECQQLPATPEIKRKSKRVESPSKTPIETNPANTLISDF